MNRHAIAGKAALVLLLGSVAAGCSTAYQEARSSELSKMFLALAAGYKEDAGPGGLIKVTYAGNERMLMFQVQDYALYRCAEIAQREGSPYFALYQTLPDALEDRASNEVKPTTLLGIPHAEVYIHLRNAPAPGLLSAADVLEKLKPMIAREGK